MTPDCELLRRYAETRSEEAFAELVRRHLDLVHSAALRQVNGDAHLAQDVAQTVFADLARKAGPLSDRAVLTGWLYTSTHFAAAKAVRGECRRQAREQEAHTMRELLHEAAPGPDWDKLHPVLDAVMHELKDTDREAILMRYFENRALADIGEKFGLSENAARMRVDRALEKLRTLLTRRGVTTTTAALSAVISANAIQIAPAGLAATLTSASLAGVAGTGGTLTFLKLMATTKLKLGLTTLVIAGTATTLLIQHQSQVSLREENQSLRQQVAQLNIDKENFSNRVALGKAARAPRLPTPPVQVAALPSTLPPELLQSTNLYARITNKTGKLTAAQIEPYLNANRRNAASLLAAYRTTGDSALLEEAKQKYPDDPQVGFEAVFRKDAPAEERRQWLEAFKKSAPDNALPNYLLASDYFKAGQADQAVQELMAASGKERFQDYTLDRIQDDEEAYLAAGYSVAEAKTIPSFQLLLPQLLQMKELSQNLFDLANSYRGAGDPTSAQAALQLAADLGQRYSHASPGEPEISRLVGIAIERTALGRMDPNSPYGSTGQTVTDRLDQLTQQRAAIKEFTSQFDSIQQHVSDQDWISYKDRWRAFGEEAALRWIVSKYGHK